MLFITVLAIFTLFKPKILIKVIYTADPVVDFRLL